MVAHLLRSAVLGFAILTSSAAWAGQGDPPPKAKEKVSQFQIDQAIAKGCEFLKKNTAMIKEARVHGVCKFHFTELVLLTYLHAGVSETDPVFVGLLDDMLKYPLECTYPVALQAMVLEELDRAKYQWRIKQCAQFLLDNQCDNGQWGYGQPTELDPPPADAFRKDEASSGKPTVKHDIDGKRIKPQVGRIAVQSKRTIPGSGDNSNTQYAALGMRACYDAGIVIPGGVIEKSIRWYRDSQKVVKDEPIKLELGDKDDLLTGKTAVMTMVTAQPRGWCYLKHDEHAAYASMTAGAVSGLCIWLYIRDNDGGRGKRSWKKDPNVLSGLAWMAKHFNINCNVGPYEGIESAPDENARKSMMDSQIFYHYYLYAIERVGMLYGTDFIGPHDWYQDGAYKLVKSQRSDGSWTEGHEGIHETCFAILFLARATQKLTPSVYKK